MKNERIKILAAFSLICFIWGSTWLAIRIGLKFLTPLYSSGFRFLLAGILILLWMRLKKMKLQMDKISIRFYILMSLFTFIIPYALIYWAEESIPSGLAAVLYAVYPFFVVLFSFFLITEEKIGPSKITGIIIGFAGIIVIFSDDLGGDITIYLLAMAAIVLSGIMQAGVSVVIKKHGHHLNPLTMNFIPMLIAGLALLVLAYFNEDYNSLSFNSEAAMSIIYLALFGSIITFTSYYWLLQRTNVVLLSMMTFITPIVAVILGWLTYNEKLSVHQIWGSILVLAGLLWANLGSILRLKNGRLFKPA